MIRVSMNVAAERVRVEMDMQEMVMVGMMACVFAAWRKNDIDVLAEIRHDIATQLSEPTQAYMDALSDGIMDIGLECNHVMEVRAAAVEEGKEPIVGSEQEQLDFVRAMREMAEEVLNSVDRFRRDKAVM